VPEGGSARGAGEVRTGVLLVNLGTPDAPRPAEVRRYLREFLGDPRVLDGPALARLLLLELAILPRRPRAAARAYAKIWTPEGSPLLVHGEALRAALARELGPEYAVVLGMRYGRPSLRAAAEALAAADVARVLALPLFPQWSEAATASAEAKLFEELARAEAPPVSVLPPFYAEPRFVAALASVARPHLAELRPDHVLFSYHGLPERQVRAADRSGRHCLASAACCDAIGAANARCYRAHCFATTRAVAAALGLAADAHSTSFQSRLGRTPWIQPFTDEVLPRLAARGVRRLAVLCPSFVADCLETLEEIAIRAAEQWRGLGGVALRLVPSLNAEPVWVRTVADWIRERA
jgi:protoporphyrin/coproporphyrin ferrochelatase